MRPRSRTRTPSSGSARSPVMSSPGRSPLDTVPIRSGKFASVSTGATPDDGEHPVGRTLTGDVRGRRNDGICVFKGVPYGATTGGEHRFLAPHPPEAWTGVRDAFDYGPRAPQPDDAISQAFSGGVVEEMSEDCLVLNVWTPAPADGGRRPVMVWFHGGGFSRLSGAATTYDGTALCTRGDVVVVTVNHRLNV